MLILFFTLIQILWAQDSGDRIFLPHMVDHPFVGCPENSRCNEELGKRFLTWKNLLKKGPPLEQLTAFAQEQGIPLKVYIPHLLDGPFISWDSELPIHRLRFDKALYFFKKQSGLKEVEGLKLALALSKQGEVIRHYFIPRDEKPLAKSGKYLIFLIEEEGNYFSLQIDDEGGFSLIERMKKNKNFPQHIPCPEDLLTHARSLKHGPTPLHQYSCESLWDEEKNQRQSILYLRGNL